ncbi:dysbindin protein homolog isoform X3 [Halyomorpha halys]|uniref:dysbindin protein homolog isoform X3 n=1 Tax=Halyomorpha halys TaxID=286706 RepID=UPI0006D50D37|nr:dysbindin protein homolog isoform X3 [Halyomorpha halys]
MLSNLKEKLHNVQEGIVYSLSRDDTSFLTHQREYLAGAHLLSKYQHDWQGIHALSEQNAAQAKTIDIQIEEVNRCIKHHWHVVKKFSSDVGDLNIILTHTEKALNEIEKLAEDYEIRLKVIDEEKDKLKKKSFQLAEKKFLEEINAYKESGMLPKKAEGQQLLKIEDIEIEQDLSVLQEYLDG